ncbi:MAG: hypothetical protein ABR975_04955 [Vulcanimicrobiaceae bacterium]|jgi:hypothetical protein
MVGAVAQVQAQTVPATTTAPTTSGTTTPTVAQQPAPTSGNSGAPHTGFNVSHYPVIDIVPIYTDEQLQNSRPGFTFQHLDVGGTVKIPISTKLSVSFDRNVGGTVDTAPERILSPTTGAPTYENYTRDVVLVERADWQFDPHWLLEGGFQFRHRAYAGCEGAANDGTATNGCPLKNAYTSENSGISSSPFPYTDSSTEAHWGYLGLTYTTPRIPELFNIQFAFNFTGDDQKSDQNVAVLCSAATTYPGCASHVHQIIYIPEGAINTNSVGRLCTLNAAGVNSYSNCPSSYLESTQYVAAIIPFTHGITGVVNYSWGALNFYENQEFPWRWTSAMTYSVTDKFNPFVAFTLRWKNNHEVMEDIPYPSPNVNHVGSFDAYFTFHVDTGAWFH